MCDEEAAAPAAAGLAAAAPANADAEAKAITPPNKALFPHDLAFLAEPECNPDLTDKDVRLKGHMRVDTKSKEDDESRGHCGCLRQFVGYILNTWTVQGIVLLVILYDFIMTMIGFSGALPEDHICFKVGDWMTVIILSADVLARFFFEGIPFLKQCLNVFELVLVPITIAEIFFLSNMDLPVPLLRVLRPIFRGVRIVRVLARAASKTNRYLLHLRHTVSGDRIRFMQDGFDLDLAYITPQIICTSVPAVGRDSWVRNPANEVARFLNERHGNKYVLLNATTETKYDTSLFFERCAQFPIMKDSVPNLEGLMALCQNLDTFLKASPEHVLAVHSRNGQGRASLLIIALLIYRGAHRTAAAAIAFFEHTRVEPEKRGTAVTQTVDSASQRRFLEYFSYMCNTQQFDRALPSALDRPVKLKRIIVHGLPNVHQVDVCCFPHPGSRLKHKKYPQEAGYDRASSGSMADLPVTQLPAEVLEDDGDDDIEATEASGVEKGRMMDRVKKAVEEGTYDSHRAGCNALPGQPIFSSYPDSSVHEKVTAKVAPAKDDGLSPGAWDFQDMELSGEIRVEIHRRKKKFVSADTNGKQASKKKPKGGGEDVAFDGGLMVACWLHTAYLEHDEPSIANRRQLQNQVIVYLDRFSLDKGAHAPTLRSHSAGLRVQLEFEVDNRKDKIDVVEEDHETRFKLTSSANVSDTETMNWLTWVSSQIWPSFESGFKSLIDGLIPSLAESLPGPLKNIRLTSFSLGDSYPKFGPITASSRRHDGFEVQLDIVLDWQTETNIVLDMSIASFAISHLKIHGVLSLKFKPILPELPVFTAMQILFLNSPTIDLKFAKGLEIANSSMVRKIIFGAINKGLGDLMVLPNIMNINWADPEDLSDKAVTFKNVLPCALIRLGIMEGRHLTTESSMFRKLPDAYTKVQLGTQLAQTRTIRQSSNPVWGQEYDLLLYDERQTLNVSVFDIDLTGRSSNVGAVVDLKVADIIIAGPEGKWVDLLPQKTSMRSQVLLKASVFDLTADPRQIEAYCRKVTSSNPVSPSEPTRAPTSPGAPGPTLQAQENAREEEAADGIDVKGNVALTEAQREAGTVVLLACEIFGGRLPGDTTLAKDVILRVSVGDAVGEQACAEAAKVDPGTMGDRTQKSIERLAAHSVTADVIAEALGESEADVNRIMRKQGWNLECSQKICVMAHPQDLSAATGVSVRAVGAKDKFIGSGSVPLSSILQNTHARHSEVISLVDELGCIVLELDLEMRLYALNEQQLESDFDERPHPQVFKI
jgi:phosphatidylinositol-3,4,5-trisphosphate 3-phosphatase/dual-specificity protein phosphatase PTEN